MIKGRKCERELDERDQKTGGWKVKRRQGKRKENIID